MRKSEARALFKARRQAISAPQAAKLDDLLLISFQQAQIPYLEQVLSFYPAEDKAEPDTFLLIRYLEFVNPVLSVAYPRIKDNGEMEALVPLHDEAFIQNEYQIWEPSEGQLMEPSAIDLVLVPLLAFDEKGNRAGYGKGYYDRFLLRCRPDCIKVGLSYFEPVPHLEDADEFDIPLDICITPQKVYVF